MQDRARAIRVAKNTLFHILSHRKLSENHINQIQCLLKSHPALINERNVLGQTSLFFAIEKGHSLIIPVLLAAGADVHVTVGVKALQAIHFAAQLGRLAIIKILLDREPSLIEVADACGQTPLLWAAATGHAHTANYLMEQGAKPGVVSNSPSDFFHGRSPLDWAAICGYANVVATLLKYEKVCRVEDALWIEALRCFTLKVNPRAALLNHAPEMRHPNGDTLLHKVIQTCRSAKDVINLLLEVGYKAFLKMAKTYNDDNKLPIHLFSMYQLRVNKRDKNKILGLLVLFTTKHTLGNLSEPVNFNKINERYHPEPNSELYQYLQQGCDAVNYSRGIITQSYTHPQSNTMPYAKRVRLDGKIEVLRSKMHAASLDQGARLIEQERIGNCHEFTWVILNYFYKQQSGIQAQAYHVKGSDHAFVVLGDMDKPSATVVDGWAGKVFPAAFIAKELGCYSYLKINQVELNAVTNFNPNCHAVAPKVGLNYLVALELETSKQLINQDDKKANTSVVPLSLFAKQASNQVNTVPSNTYVPSVKTY